MIFSFKRYKDKDCCYWQSQPLNILNMKKQSILVGVLSLSAFAMGTTTTFATVKSENATTLEASCGDKKAEAKTDSKTKEASCGEKKEEKKAKKSKKTKKTKEGKCGEGKCGNM